DGAPVGTPLMQPSGSVSHSGLNIQALRVMSVWSGRHVKKSVVIPPTLGVAHCDLLVHRLAHPLCPLVSVTQADCGSSCWHSSSVLHGMYSSSGSCSASPSGVGLDVDSFFVLQTLTDRVATCP